jgi:ribonuclease BN (tRNA processing enzyme)
MRLTILGCGDAFGSGGRLNTCFLLEAAGACVLVDCGASALVSMGRYGVDPDGLDAVILSHLHGDHFGGVPFLLLHQQFEARRSRPLEIVGPPGTRERVEAAGAALFGGIDCDWRFELRYREIEPGGPVAVQGLQVEPLPVAHGDGAPCYGLRIAGAGRTFAFSGDTAWTDTLPALADGADLFVMECYAFDERQPTHCDYRTLEARLPELTAKRIALTHMSRAMLDRLDDVALETLHDGKVIDI